VDVHGDEVGLECRDHLDGRAAVAGVAHDLDLGVGREDLTEHLARDERVVDDDDPDRPAHAPPPPPASDHRALRSP
jgi:hypothetical protein